MMRFILALLLVTYVSAASAETALSDPKEEARAVTLGAEFRCVVCQSQSINDSQADMARNMRLMIRDKIRDGWSDRQIYDYIRSRYGDFILLRPPFQKNTLLLWLCPLLFVAGAGGWILRSFFRRKPLEPRDSL